MHRHVAIKLLSLAASLLSVMVITGLMLPATTQPNEFAGQVLSASGALVVGGEATNPGHPVVGATVHLVPTAAIDVSTQMTASSIYASPYPAEAYDEPLEDGVRDRAEEEIGDILFVLANIARRWGVNAEEALRQSTRKFERRFREIENGLAERGIDVQRASLVEMEEVYQAAKAAEKHGD